MTTAIGVVITDHIAAARLKELRLARKVLRYPGERDAVGALEAIPRPLPSARTRQHIGRSSR
jgi:hypothetical protein